MSIYLHQNKAILTLRGEESADFLNDLLTAQVKTLPADLARPACLLSPQGRVLFDMLVIGQKDIFYLVTEAAQAQELLKKLTLYRMRRAIEIAILADRFVCHIETDAKSRNDLQSEDGTIIAKDERHEDLGYLGIIPQTVQAEFTDDEVWQFKRIELGIPEGAGDLTPNRALMLEAGLHQLGAVDFKKGCYIGQEVTARTHYRGLVKRRLLPIYSDDAELQAGEALIIDEKIVGQCHSCAHSDNRFISLASVRLDAVQTVLNKGAILRAAQAGPVLLAIPDWMHPLPGFDSSQD